MPAAPVEMEPLLRAGQSVDVTDTAVIETPDGGRVPVSLLGGSVSVDVGRQWRRECRVVLAPDTPVALLRPGVGRLRIERTLSCGARSWTAPLGVYGWEEPSRSVGREWSLSGQSLEARVVAARFLKPETLTGYSHVAQIQRLVKAAVPDAEFVVTATRNRPALSVVVERERWDIITGTDESLARAIGAEVYCGWDGSWVIRDVPDGTVEPAWTALVGEQVVDARESLSIRAAHNIVVASGERVEGTGILPSGVWWDGNPASPTFVGSRTHAILSGRVPEDQAAMQSWPDDGIGPRPRFFASPLLADDTQASLAAASLGRSQIGLARTVAFETVPNWWLDVGDVIAAESSTLGRHVITSLDLGVGADRGRSMTIGTREMAA